MIMALFKFESIIHSCSIHKAFKVVTAIVIDGYAHGKNTLYLALQYSYV